MAFYSREPLRALRQVLADLALLVWVIVWVQVARAVHAAVTTLATPLTALVEGADRVGANLEDAGRQASRVPLVGRELAGPLDRAAQAMSDLGGAGTDQVLAVQETARWVGLAVFAVPVVCLLLVWVPARVRFVARSVTARRLAASAGGHSVLALRALTGGTPGQLLGISSDPVAAWRRDDPQVVAALARLELRRAGVRRRPPR